MLSSAFVATLEFIGVDPSRLDLLTDLLPFIRQEIDRRRDAVRDFVEHLVPGQRELLTLEQFSGLPEAEQLEFRSLMGLGQVEEMAAVPEEASDDVRRQYLIRVMLSPVFAENMQDLLTQTLSGAPLDARLDALENMKRILEPDSHAGVALAGRPKVR